MKKTTLITSLFLSAILVTSVLVLAMPNLDPVNVPVLPSNGKATVTIPTHATEIAPGIFDLGFAIDPATGKLVQGLAIVKYKENHARGGKKKPKPSENICYSFLASGAKWKDQEDYSINPSNNAGLTDATKIRNIIKGNIDNWEGAAGDTSIFGTEVTSLGSNLGLDGENEVFFADVASPGAIAVTEVWGVWSGRPSNRRIVEWNMVFDDVDFDWSAEDLGVAGKMDLDNIGNHEMGHALGLGHSGSCSEETMYAYASEGETKKRTLEAGDIAGIRALYA